jgi:hypothetical protein
VVGVFSLRTQIPVFVTALLLVAPVEATTTYYAGGASAQTAFNAAIGSLILLNPGMTFSGDLEPNGLFNAAGTGIDFLGIDDYHFNDPLGFTLSSGKLIAAEASEQVTINFPANIYAFGILISEVSGAGNWCIELTHGTCSYNPYSSSPSAAVFFGVVSDTPLTASLYIRNSGGNPQLVLPLLEAYTHAAVVVTSAPEPRTMLLIGLGLVILPLVRRKVRLS